MGTKYIQKGLPKQVKQQGSINVHFQYKELTPELKLFLENVIDHFLAKASEVDAITEYDWDFKFGFSKDQILKK